MELRYCINYLLTILQYEIFQTFFSRLSPYRITPGQHGVLSCLWRNGPTIPREIARASCLENLAASDTLNRMQEQDLIDRVVDLNNRRSILVTATPSAMAIKDDALKVVDRLNVEMLQDFTPQEKDVPMENLRCIGWIDEEG